MHEFARWRLNPDLNPNHLKSKITQPRPGLGDFIFNTALSFVLKVERLRDRAGAKPPFPTWG
jgi:hypothetical protein